MVFQCKTYIARRHYFSVMDEKFLLNKAKEEGFATIEDYVKANLHYLPKEKQELFCILTGYSLPDPYGKKYYKGNDYDKS